MGVDGHLWHPVSFLHEPVFESDLNIAQTLMANTVIGIRIGQRNLKLDLGIGKRAVIGFHGRAKARADTVECLSLAK